MLLIPKTKQPTIVCIISSFFKRLNKNIFVRMMHRIFNNSDSEIERGGQICWCFYLVFYVKFLFQPVKIADFTSIEAIQTMVSDCETHRKPMLELRVAGATETLIITCPSEHEMDSLADLIDGYCRLQNNNGVSLWNRTGKSNIKQPNRYYFCYFFFFIKIIAV